MLLMSVLLISQVYMYSILLVLTSNNTDCGTEGAEHVVRGIKG